MTVLLVGLGGFAGAVARYLIDGWVTSHVRDGFPWGTFVINMGGSFAVGVLFGLAIERTILPADIRAPLMIGFIGAYTTFSTLMLETWRLWETGAHVPALLNVIGSSVVGIVAVVAGLAMARGLA